MKIFIKLYVLLIANVALAQYPITHTSSLANPNDNLKIIEMGNYAKDLNNEREQYVGTWRYEENGILFDLKIEKADQFLDKMEYNGTLIHYFYCDVVTFKYKLVRNGATLYDNLNQTNTEGISTGYKMASYPFLSGRFLDYTRNVKASVEITKLNTMPEKIHFYLNQHIYTLLNPREYYNDGQRLFNVPVDGIDMVRVN